MSEALPSTEELTEKVLGQLCGQVSSERLKTILESLIRHSHALALEVGLSEAELQLGADFLRRTGQKCDDHRQEFLLLFDVLGISMLVDAVSTASAGGTSSSLLGPFRVQGAPQVSYGESLIRSEQPAGEVVLFLGKIVDQSGEGVPGAQLETWSTDGHAAYFVQDSNAEPFNLYGNVKAKEDGSYCFVSELPVSYPIPVDGPVGELMQACKRQPMRPAHTHFIVSAEGYQQLQTQLFRCDDTYLHDDPVFAVKEELIVEFNASRDEQLAMEFGLPEEFRILEFDFILTRL